MHLRQAHGEEEFRRVVLAAKEAGMPDAQIGARYGVSFSSLEQIITEAYGANISVLKSQKRVKRWEPLHFREETTTVWSFKQRGDWATHDGRYRGNWSPYIPRNVILKYSQPGDVVLDYFVGGGTTAVEAKLLGRRCIARDINPGAIGITRENLDFSPPRPLFGEGTMPLYEPEVSVGDARDLSDIPDASIDLICAHPPYGGIIKYSAKVQGDLSELSIQEFLSEMRKVARESLRVLKPGGKCAILIGDARKSKHVVPIGFQTVRVFLDAGFDLHELVIKRQHNCKTTGFWYTKSVKHNFLLLAHEYLPIFIKPEASRVSEQRSLWEYAAPHCSTVKRVLGIERENLETTTVWILPQEHLDVEIKRNLLGRFATPSGSLVEVMIHTQQFTQYLDASASPSLVYIAPPQETSDNATVASYRAAVKRIAEQFAAILQPGSFLAIDTRDLRIDGSLYPLGLTLWEDLRDNNYFSIKEIVIVVPERALDSTLLPNGAGMLNIIHRYLLVFKRT
jgi:SAM-dependent methyltransferase